MFVTVPGNNGHLEEKAVFLASDFRMAIGPNHYGHVFVKLAEGREFCTTELPEAIRDKVLEALEGEQAKKTARERLRPATRPL